MIEFSRKILFVGYGAVAECTLPIIFKHLKVPASNVTVMDFEDRAAKLRQWTDKGYISCRATIPMGICDHCGSKTWDDDAEAIIEEAVRQEYQKLP